MAECADELWLMGSGLADVLEVPPGTTRRIECGPFAPSAWSTYLAREVRAQSVVLAATTDGRDLAGQLAQRLGVDVVTGCTEITDSAMVSVHYGGATSVVQDTPAHFVATLQVRNRSGNLHAAQGAIEIVPMPSSGDVQAVREEAPDPETVDLADATLIFAGGAGLTEQQSFVTLARCATALHAAMGATRVITDRGWVSGRRQIGTTGVTVKPELYVAFGISGAVQHTSGLGSPRHIISINTDPSCPMHQMADVALVADADATLLALETLLGDN